MRTVLVAALSVLCACGPSVSSIAAPSDVTLTVNPARVTPGDTVTLTLRNDTATAIGYNLCVSALARRGDGGWQPLRSDRVCTMELRTLQPGADDSFRLEVPADLEPGAYRYHTSVEVLDGGSRFGVASQPFQIDS